MSAEEAIRPDAEGPDEEGRRVRRFFVIFMGTCGALLLARLLWDYQQLLGGIGEFLRVPAGVAIVVLTLGVVLAWGAGWLSSFLAHAIAALGGLLALNWMIWNYVPLGINKIGSSYLIFFYHFPSAINCFIFFLLVMVFSILYLRSEDPLWDRCSRVAGEIGLLACSIVLVTGSTWASAAWGHWWVWDDARLMTVAIMWLIYAGYGVLQRQVEDPLKRRRFAAVFGTLAFLNIPLVHYSIKLRGEISHPMEFEDLASDPTITLTRWYGVLAFLCFYALLYRWKLARERTRDRIQTCLAEVRRMEEGALA